MSDDDYDDELPPISVSTTDVDYSAITLPSAEVLARQRALEAAKEKEIQQMRQNLAEECKDDVRLLVRADSSGSENEVLTACLDTLRVASTVTRNPTTNTDDENTLAMMIEEIITTLPQEKDEFLTNYVECLKTKSKQHMEFINDDILESLLDLCSCNDWTETQLLSVASWSCVMVLGGIGGLRVRSILHYLLDKLIKYELMEKLYKVIQKCVVGASRLLLVSSAVRSGAGGGADSLSNGLLRLAVATAMDSQIQREFATDISTRWLRSAISGSAFRKLNPRSQYCVVQAVGRALAYQNSKQTSSQDAEDESNIREQLFAILAQQTSTPANKNKPEQLKVTVAVSKLQLLFRTKQ